MQTRILLKTLVFSLVACLAACAESHQQSPRLETAELTTVTSTKFPNSASEGTTPVTAHALALRPGTRPTGYTELMQYSLRAPDQDEAGSCLYMTLTGIAEWYLAKLHPNLSREVDGPIDLSERYLMNLSGDQNLNLDNWKTDSIYLLNRESKMPLNADYRFTKGWSKIDKDGDRVKAAKNAPGAIYDTTYNWIDERAKLDRKKFVTLPKFEREVLFEDPASDQWDTGVMPDDIADRIKTALREKKAPVQVIYNHFGYWHSNFIVGYDDEQTNGDCKFVRDFMDYMSKRGPELRADAAKSTDAGDRASILVRAERAEKADAQTRSAFKRGGGCHSKGVFYVRDSIYGDPKGPSYDYDPTIKGEEAPYAKATVLLEYDWARTMGNHAVQFSIQ